MIRAHKGLILALPILLATPAIAQISDDRTKMRWKPGNGQSCIVACGNQAPPVESGVYSPSTPYYFVCSVDAHQEGPRPGYQAQVPSTCTVGWGNKEETSNKYDCLCIER